MRRFRGGHPERENFYQLFPRFYGIVPDYGRDTPWAILVAEDEAINKLAVELMLKKFGYRVDSAADGLETIEKLRKSSFDCVLMDIRMPKMDGIETTRRIRGGEIAEVDRNIPIIAVTAYTLKEDEYRYVQAGMNGFIPKPIHAGDLKTTLDRILPPKTVFR